MVKELMVQVVSMVLLQAVLWLKAVAAVKMLRCKVKVVTMAVVHVVDKTRFYHRK